MPPRPRTPAAPGTLRDGPRIVPKADGRPGHAPKRAEPLRHAQFLTTAARWEQLPPGGAPEIAFAGRSNAGKSSAINALARQARLAYVSRTPGRTQNINLFRLRSGALLADLPGYGYAEVPDAIRRHWQHFIARYLAERAALIGLVIVMDARHPLTELDQQLIGWFAPTGKPMHILLTKNDKLGTQAQRDALSRVREALARTFPGLAIGVQGFSALRATGIAEADAALAAWLGPLASVDPA
jgi:GTP-binding protein